MKLEVDREKYFAKVVWIWILDLDFGLDLDLDTQEWLPNMDQKA